MRPANKITAASRAHGRPILEHDTGCHGLQPRNHCEDCQAHQTSRLKIVYGAALQQRADARAADIGPTIEALQAAGATSLRAIAAGLNEQGIPTARGQGKWSAVQVARVLERID